MRSRENPADKASQCRGCFRGFRRRQRLGVTPHTSPERKRRDSAKLGDPGFGWWAVSAWQPPKPVLPNPIARVGVSRMPRIPTLRRAGNLGGLRCRRLALTLLDATHRLRRSPFEPGVIRASCREPSVSIHATAGPSEQRPRRRQGTRPQRHRHRRPGGVVCVAPPGRPRIHRPLSLAR